MAICVDLPNFSNNSQTVRRTFNILHSREQICMDIIFKLRLIIYVSCCCWMLNIVDDDSIITKLSHCFQTSLHKISLNYLRSLDMMTQWANNTMHYFMLLVFFFLTLIQSYFQHFILVQRVGSSSVVKRYSRAFTYAPKF